MNKLTLNNLRDLAEERGIKYRSKMSKSKICDALGIEQIPLDEKYVIFVKKP